MESGEQRKSTSLVKQFLPITSWLPAYNRSWLVPDILTSITIWAILIPECLAYAQIAGVDVRYGLYSAPLALIAYAVFGGSRRLIVGPTSTIAIVSASTIAPLAAAGSQRYLSLTIALALMVGVVLIAAGVARLGFISKFLAKPVLEGFIIGLALTICIGQVGKLLGVHTSGDTALQKLISLFRIAGDWQLLPLVVGACCLALLFLAGKYLPRLPAAIIVVALTTLLAWLLNLDAHGLAIVGNVPRGFPDWQLSGLVLEDLYKLLPGACAVALISLTESLSVAKSDADKHDYKIDTNVEMIAYGIANIGAGLFQGFSVGGSLSRTAASERSGGRTQLVGIICSVLALLTMLFLTGLFKYLPDATLGAIVIHALWHYLNPEKLKRYFKVRKHDFLLSVTALLGVLLLGVLPGIFLGIVLSLVLLIDRVSRPNFVSLGRKPGGTTFADMSTHPDYEKIPGILIMRFDAALVFPNAELFSSKLKDFTAETSPPARVVIVDCEMISDMDTTASDQFRSLISALERENVSLCLARLHQQVRQFMQKDGVLDEIGEDNIYPRVMDAVAAYENGADNGPELES